MRGAINNLTINTMTVAPPDAEGRSGQTVGASTVVRGRVMIYTETELQPHEIGRFAAAIDAVAALPEGTAVNTYDQIVVTDGGPLLDGSYDVMYILDSLVHLEAYMRRRPV